MPVYQYQFTSTVEDLLEAEEAERTARTARAPFRWFVVLFGFAWVLLGLLAFDFSNPSWRPLIWLLIGSAIIYYFAVRPYLRRKKIRINNDPQQNLVLEFYDDCIKVEGGGSDRLTRRWDELLEFLDTPKGVLFYFNDGFISWLPRRVLPEGKDAHNAFIRFLQEHKSEEADNP